VLGSGTNGSVHALVTHDDGGGPALFAGGSFGSALDSGDSYLARWRCDTTPPTLSCPSSITVGDRLATLGEHLPSGHDPGRFTATDASGNQATCQFSVTVTPGVTPRTRRR
jgi:hypothetical protein